MSYKIIAVPKFKKEQKTGEKVSFLKKRFYQLNRKAWKLTPNKERPLVKTAIRYGLP